MIQTWDVGLRAKCSSFKSEQGSAEYFISVACSENLSFAEALDEIRRGFERALKETNLSVNAAVFSRIYLSDIANQKQTLIESDLLALFRDSAVSIVQQCPLNGGPACLFVYIIDSPDIAARKSLRRFDDAGWKIGMTVRGEHYSLYWTSNFTGYGSLDSREQTEEIFQDYNKFINENGMTLLNNTIRTWIYVRDIDNHYQGMVDARKYYFREQGLTEDTRYIASTGIEAKLKDVNILDSMDAFSIKSVKPEQIRRMEAPEHLSSTHAYGVTFERGTRLVFGDRAHCYISGTASIDSLGHVVHPGDPERQTRRTLENIRALLAPSRAALGDMAYLIVYIRNYKDAPRILNILHDQVVRNIPIIVVEGAVCRPDWLVEIEGMAVIPEDRSYPPFF